MAQNTAPNTQMIEAFADLAHAQWQGWMKYMLSKGTLNPDGTWTMPADLFQRWTRQMETPYSELPEEEKLSDREEAVKMISVAKLWRADIFIYW